MALTQKLNIYDTTLGQVLRFLTPWPPGPPKPPGPDKRFEDMDVVRLNYEVKLSPEAFGVLQANPLLKQKIQIDMIAIGAKIVRERIKPFMKPGEKYTPAFKQRVDNALKQGEIDVNALIDGVLRRHADMDQAWGNYYRSMRKDLIFVVVGIALSVAATALAVPTGGASITLAIIGAVKSISGAVNKLHECWRDAEEQHARIKKSLHVLLSAYLMSVGLGRAMQVSAALLDTIGLLPAIETLPFVRQQLLPSLVKIKSDMSTYKGKLGSLYAAANKLAAQLFALLDQIDEWKKANPGQIMPKLDKIEPRIAELLDSGERMARFRQRLTISGAYLRYEGGMTEYSKLDAEITRLNGIETNPRAIAIIGMSIKVLGELALAGAAYGVNGVPKSHREWDSLKVTISNDVLSTVNNFREFVETTKGDATPAQVRAAQAQFEAAYAPLAAVVPPPVPPRPIGGRVARPQGIGPRPAGLAPTQPPPVPPRPAGLAPLPPRRP